MVGIPKEVKQHTNDIPGMNKLMFKQTEHFGGANENQAARGNERGCRSRGPNPGSVQKILSFRN